MTFNFYFRRYFRNVTETYQTETLAEAIEKARKRLWITAVDKNEDFPPLLTGKLVNTETGETTEIESW